MDYLLQTHQRKKGESMRFSLVSTVYNSEDFLSPMINSVLDQSYCDWELILVDNGSTDKSSEIIKEYVSEYPHKIKQYRIEDNVGLLNGQLIGNTFAQGDYLLYPDSDDMYRKDALEILNFIIDNNNPDFILFNGSNDINYKSIYKTGCFDVEQEYPIKRERLLKSITERRCCAMWNKAIRNDIKDDSKTYLQVEPLTYCGDSVRTFVLADKAKRAFYLKDPIYFYRVRAQSISNTTDPHKLMNNIKESEKALPFLLDYAKKWSNECAQSPDALSERTAFSDFETNVVIAHISLVLRCIEAAAKTGIDNLRCEMEEIYTPFSADVLAGIPNKKINRYFRADYALLAKALKENKGEEKIMRLVKTKERFKKVKSFLKEI